jgi:hypothetical protein
VEVLKGSMQNNNKWTLTFNTNTGASLHISKNSGLTPSRTICKRYGRHAQTLCSGLNHICVRLGPTPPTAPSLPGLPVHTCVGTLPRWEPMWQNLAKITNIQVDITLIIPKLVDGVSSHAKGAWWLKWSGIVTLVPNKEEFSRMCGQEEQAM